MAKITASVLNRIKKLATSPDEVDLAASRAEQLADQLPLSRLSPSLVARSTLLQPAAQRGFSESIVSSRAPFGVQVMKPSTFLEHAPPFTSPQDEVIIQRLKASLQKEKLKDSPLLWIEEYKDPLNLAPEQAPLEAGYEGRHRMQALQELYGDEPVPLSLIRGGQYTIEKQPYYPLPNRAYLSDQTSLSPLELIRQEIQFGNSPITLDPLWMRE